MGTVPLLPMPIVYSRDPRFRRDPGRFARVDDPGIAIAVGEQYEHLALGFRPAQAVDRRRDAVADRGRQFLLQRLGIDHPPLTVANRLGNFEPLDDIDQSAVIEGQRTLAVGEPPEGDEPDEIIRAARQSARAGAEHEFLDDVLDGLQPADVPALELKVDGLHRAGNVEHDLDGDPLAGNPRFRLPRLRPGQPGNHQAQAQSVEIRQAASQPLRQGDGKTFEIGHAGENRRGSPLRTKSPPERAHRDGCEDQPERRIESKCVHGNDLAPLDPFSIRQGAGHHGSRRRLQVDELVCPGDCLVNLTLTRLLPGVLDQVGCLQEFRELDGTLRRKRGPRPHVAQEFLRRLLGGPDPRRVLNILADDAGEPQIEFLDQAARREVLRQQLRQGRLRDLLGSLTPRFDRPALSPSQRQDARGSPASPPGPTRSASRLRSSAAPAAAATSVRDSPDSALRPPAPT